MEIEFHKHLSYPTLSEENDILKEFPEVLLLSLPFINLSVDPDLGLDEFVREQTHDPWYLRVLNRLNDVRFTYVLIKHSYKKGIPDEEWKTRDKNGKTYFFQNLTEDQHVVNKFLFDYYSDVFLYQYFSFLDILHKLINIRFNLRVNENSKGFNFKVVQKLAVVNPKLSAALNHHYRITVTHRESRNKLTHAFSEFQIDLRPSVNNDSKRKSITFSDGKYTTSSTSLNSIEKLIIDGSSLIQQVVASFNAA